MLSAEIYRRVLDPIRGVPLERLREVADEVSGMLFLGAADRAALGNFLLRAATVIAQESAVIDLGEKLWIETLEADLARRLQEEG